MDLYKNQENAEEFGVSIERQDWWATKYGPRVRITLNKHIPYSLEPVSINISPTATKKLILQLENTLKEIQNIKKPRRVE